MKKANTKRSSVKHRLISRSSEIFAGSPDLTEVADTSKDVSIVVAYQLGMPTPRRDQKSMCGVLFSGKKGKQVVQSPMPKVDSSLTSTMVSEDFLLVEPMLLMICGANDM